MFLITFLEGNGHAEVEENNSNDTLVYDDDAHKVVLSIRSHFFCMRWVLLRLKKTIQKGKIQVCKKQKIDQHAPQKMTKIQTFSRILKDYKTKSIRS